jgi:predicted RNase H-like nuclease (RuvC/YqgF family)
MSSMAKIFVVVNLVFVVLVLGGVSALLGAQDDYKTKLEEQSRDFAAFRENSSKTVQAKEAEVNAQTLKASQSESRAKEAEALRDTAQSSARDAATLAQKLGAAAEANASELANLRKILEEKNAEVDAMRKRSDEANKNYLDNDKKLQDEIANRVRAEGQISQQNDQIASLSAEKGDLEKKMRDLEFWIGVYREKFGPIEGGKGAPGVVLAVKNNLVSISVGSQDGVKMGDEYHLRRGGAYVGRIIIKSVMKNSAVGEFDESFTGSGAPPQVNDSAYTK